MIIDTTIIVWFSDQNDHDNLFVDYKCLLSLHQLIRNVFLRKNELFLPRRLATVKEGIKRNYMWPCLWTCDRLIECDDIFSILGKTKHEFVNIFQFNIPSHYRMFRRRVYNDDFQVQTLLLYLKNTARCKFAPPRSTNSVLNPFMFQWRSFARRWCLMNPMWQNYRVNNTTKCHGRGLCEDCAPTRVFRFNSKLGKLGQILKRALGLPGLGSAGVNLGLSSPSYLHRTGRHVPDWPPTKQSRTLENSRRN